MAERADSDPGSLTEWPEQVIGGKRVRLLQRQLDQLRSEQDHGNRQLFVDVAFAVHLLAFFNPSVRTLRTIEDFSQTRQVHKYLSIHRICKNTLSDDLAWPTHSVWNRSRRACGCNRPASRLLFRAAMI